MLVALVFVRKAKRSSVFIDRKYRAAGKVYTDSDNIFFIDSGTGYHLWNYMLQHQRKIVRIFKRPVGRKLLSGFGKVFVDNAVWIVHHRICHFMPVAYPYEQGASG